MRHLHIGALNTAQDSLSAIAGSPLPSLTDVPASWFSGFSLAFTFGPLVRPAMKVVTPQAFWLADGGATDSEPAVIKAGY
ncbi:MAG: hypothetical protein WA510_06925 [Acidobacteriaceae bacterium]